MKLWLDESQVCQFADVTTEQVKAAAKEDDPTKEALATRRLKGKTVYDALSVIRVFKLNPWKFVSTMGLDDWVPEMQVAARKREPSGEGASGEFGPSSGEGQEVRK